MNALRFRFAITTIVLGVKSAIPAIAVGYGNPPAGVAEPAVITSLNQAVSQGMAFNRRFQSAGIDTVVDIYGQVQDDGKGAPPANPARALTAPESAEQNFGNMDTPDHNFLKAIKLSNRVAAGVNDFADQLPEDASQ